MAVRREDALDILLLSVIEDMQRIHDRDGITDPITPQNLRTVVIDFVKYCSLDSIAHLGIDEMITTHADQFS